MMPIAPFSWQKGRQIGQGGFGTVFMGLVHATGQEIAVKQVSLPRDPASGQVQIYSLEREVNVLRKLRHENIVRYLGTERTSEHLNIFLEYVAGGSLANKLAQFGPLREETVRVYTKQILRGVQYLHQHRVMHRDIKGANILVDTNGVVKLADFGASKQLEDLATIGGGARSLHGTAHWMAPEVIRQQGHGCQADIWSLACVVIEMATGRPPWAEYKTPHSVMYHVASTRDLPPMPEWLSPQAKDFLTLCFNRVPRERPNATRLLSHPWMQGVAVPRATTPPPNPLPLAAAMQASPRTQQPVQAVPQQQQPAGMVSSPIKEEPDSHLGLIAGGTAAAQVGIRPSGVPPLRLDAMKASAPQAPAPAAPGHAMGPLGSQRAAAQQPMAPAPAPLMTKPAPFQPPANGFVMENHIPPEFQTVVSKFTPPPPAMQQQPQASYMPQPQHLQQPQMQHAVQDPDPVPLNAGAVQLDMNQQPQQQHMSYNYNTMSGNMSGNPYDSMAFNPLVEPSWMPSNHPAQMASAAAPSPTPADQDAAGSPSNGAASNPIMPLARGEPHPAGHYYPVADAPAPPPALVAPAEDALPPPPPGSMPRKGTAAMQRGTAHGTKAVVVPSRPPLAGIFAAAYEGPEGQADASAADAGEQVADGAFSPRDQAPKLSPMTAASRPALSARRNEETGVLGGGGTITGGGTLDPKRAKQWRDELEAELAAERDAMLSARAVMAGRPSVADL
ncbi:hypothetical protein GPECTOR_375g163 [Gonium pectorale]|uniref:mitogen-activated protein kinase kinase kinase n=1 Tax=Gonium pectorale TaxID=33097 RepID=A0A150FVF7_GONPE|nr:hypothetical protein GPECTOR_375g163 [Gonium pectorale]|eukprot:KXZ41594.1 hypothetical protein GPECTOR_375g163 [Gonium pectorale]